MGKAGGTARSDPSGGPARMLAWALPIWLGRRWIAKMPRPGVPYRGTLCPAHDRRRV